MPSQMDGDGFTIYYHLLTKMAPFTFAPPQPIRAFPWYHSVAYLIHLISTLKTDYKQFPQNHSWLTVLPFIFADGLPIILFLRFSWLRPNQSGHLERIHLISLSNLPSTHSNQDQTIRPLRPRFKKPFHKTFTNTNSLDLLCLSTVHSCLFLLAFKTFANLYIPLWRTKQPISSTCSKMHIVILASLIVPWSTLYPPHNFLPMYLYTEVIRHRFLRLNTK